jgi:hypothetical protein
MAVISSPFGESMCSATRLWPICATTIGVHDKCNALTFGHTRTVLSDPLAGTSSLLWFFEQTTRCCGSDWRSGELRWALKGRTAAAVATSSMSCASRLAKRTFAIALNSHTFFSRLRVSAHPSVRPSTRRGYPFEKVQENVEAEIMEVIASEARESYDPSIVMEVRNDTPEQMEEGLDAIAGWVEQCRSM